MTRSSILAYFLLSSLLLACTDSGSRKAAKTSGDPLIAVDTTGPHPTVDLVAGQVIASPITVEINSMGYWAGHEGELGEVKLYDDSNALLASAIMRTKDGNWMTSGPAFYLAELQFESGEAMAGRMVFQNRVITDEGNNREKAFEVPVRFTSEPQRTLCFAEKTPAANSDGDHYSYHFIEIRVARDNHVHGTFIQAPYGIDGSRGSILGTLNTSSNTITGKLHKLAEGDLYAEDFSYKILDERLDLGFEGPDGKPFSLAALACADYTTLLKEYRDDIMDSRINTTERSRLVKSGLLDTFGFSSEQAGSVRFMEMEVSLDHDYATREFLMYVIDPMVCGTGGCTLFILDEAGKVLSRTSVVKLPIYIPVETAADMGTSGWKDLYVWSDHAFRKLSHRDGAYSANASLAPAMAEENLAGYPEKYFVLLDWPD